MYYGELENSQFKTDFLVNEYEEKLFFESDRASGNPRE